MSNTSFAGSNRLAQEKSPYLLQHAQNPVDWFPWGPEAFEKAHKENKPVLLSIGYSTCHWCHVMEHESFEDPVTARLMNESFVSIKVDREERPDIDHLYMNYVMSTTGSGGWPMTVFLTPDKKPFYGGTYFPPEDRFGMPGFKSLLMQISDAWKNRKHEIVASADSAALFLAEKPKVRSEEPLSASILDQTFENYAARFDKAYGGFGRAPKFPMGHTISFLLRYGKRTKKEEAFQIALDSLKAMAYGGLYDHLGGGFHRYSTDAQWRIPHFEKMLYDQALLTKAYLEAYQWTHDSFFADVARETLDYVLRDMTDLQGGFHSAEDADSVEPEGTRHEEAGLASKKKREGAYYVWEKNEIEKLLGEKMSLRFLEYYGIRKEGNAISDPHHEFENKNVLYRSTQSEGPDTLLKEAKKILFEARLTRPKPHKDDKILTDWNALTISALALAYRVLGDEKYLLAAQKAAEFIFTRLKDADGFLLHRYRDGDAAIAATLDDYAFLLESCLDLYEADFDPKWLTRARHLADSMLDLFTDAENQGLYMTSTRAERLLVRPKEAYDGAIPSGNSSAAMGLLRLSRFTGDAEYQKAADRILSAFSGQLQDSGANFSKMLQALDWALGPTLEIVIAPVSQDPQLSLIINGIYSKFIPNKVVVLGPSSLEWLKDKKTMGGKTTVYLCRSGTCGLPSNDWEKIKEQLEKL